MQYYKEYLNNSSIYGKLIFKNDKYYVNDNEINNNRGIVNDEVYISNQDVVGIKKRDNKNIIGILYLDSKIKFGNFKNKSLFLFKPTDKSYPNYYVPYGNTKTNKIYVTIQFKEWEIYSKLPIGTLIEVLGDVGNKEIEFEHLRYYYEVKNNSWKKEYDIKVLEDLENKVENYTVFSIDPLGSKDIDDAFHFKILENGNIEVGIHIASPVIFFEKDLEKVLNRVSTIYTPVKNYNLLPEIYSTNIVSLLEGKKRFALSLICEFDNMFNLIGYYLKETIVKNIKNYSYEEFDVCSKKFIHFIEFTKTFFKLTIIDSHKLVECWMIYTNKMIAKILIDRDAQNIILRVHKPKIMNESIYLEDEKLLHYLNIKSENSATYQIYDNLKEQKHSKLGDEYYTHFTSPIRRAVDFFIHMLILQKDYKYTSEELAVIINNINIFTKNAKKFDRNVKRLDFLYNIKNLNDNIITYGYIIKISNYYIKIFIPDYHLEEKVILINNKFKNIAESEIIDNEIIYMIDGLTKKYTLYQKINIKLWVFTLSDNIFDKLKIEFF